MKIIPLREFRDPAGLVYWRIAGSWRVEKEATP
jgi:hypothetical protein